MGDNMENTQSISSKQLDEILSTVRKRAGGIGMNEAYVDGKNPYILGKEPGKKPDNRIPVPLAKMAVEAMAGYAGRSGDIVTTYELVSDDVEEDDDLFISYMRAMDSFNQEQLETAELYEEVLIQGKSYEMWWTSDDLELPGILTAEYKIVPTSSVYIKYTDSVKKKIEYAVYFSGDSDDQKADVLFPGLKQTWEKSGNAWKLAEESEQPFTEVPIIKYTGGRRERPLFEAEKPLIDSFDELISKSLNEVDRYNALITLLGNQVDKEFVEAYLEGKISVIDNLNMEERSDLPRYLEKNLGGVETFYNNLTDRIETLFHKSIKIPDMSDEAFAGNASGIAIAYKLIGMEFKAAQIETYFNQGLKKRLGFYADIYNASSSASVNTDDYKATVHTTRNIPIDIKAKAEVAMILSTMVSEETLLKFIPKEIVDDVKKEMERKKEERDNALLEVPSMGTIETE